MKRVLLICFFITGLSCDIYAQVVTGKVLDKTTGVPLAGVSVAVEHTKSETTTNVEGSYSLQAKKGDILLFSYVGMDSQRITVEADKIADIYMSSKTSELNEIVVIGYGTVKRKDLTGSISSIKGEDIKKTTSANVISAIAGKVSGVQVIQNSGAPGGDVTVRVRGIGTLNNSDPLYVVDGIPVNSGIWYLNPNDIESIDVLKDASATAIYGSRGANGVVMVTTKNGVRGKTELTVDYSRGFQQVAKKYQMLNAAEYAALHNDMRRNGGASLNPDFANPGALGTGTNWLDQILEVAPTQKVSASLSGGDKTLYSLSLGYAKQDGVIKNTSFDRATLQSNVQSQVSDKFKVTSNIALSAESRDLQDAFTLVSNAMRMLPTIPVYDSEGNFAGPTGFAEWNGNAINPLGILTVQKNNNKAYRGLANVTGEYAITDYLQFKTVGGTEIGYNLNDSFNPRYKWGMSEQAKTIQTGSSAYESLMLWDNTLTFNKTFGKNRITALVGTSYQTYINRSLNARGVDRASDQVTELDNAIIADKVGGSTNEWALMSYFGRVNYIYNDKYFLTASLRADGSSRFGANNRYGYFPSFSGAWVVSNESFMKNVTPVNSLKLRAGYGQTGNQNIGSYTFSDNLEVLGQYNFGSSATTASVPVGLIYPDRLANPNVKWESAEQYNVGFDLSFLKNRITLTGDFYLKNTNDMLLQKPVPQTSGSSLELSKAPYINVGKIRNTGMEYTLSTENINSKNFKWNSSFNISFNKNKIMSLDGQDILSGVTLNREGLPAFSFYGFSVDHIYQNWDDVYAGVGMENRAPNRNNADPTKNTAPGDIAFKKYTDGDVISDKDRVVLGSPHPNFIAGLSNNFSYKNFDLSFFIQAVSGNKIWNGVRIQHEGMSSTYNQLVTTLDRWTTEGMNTTIPRAVYADPNNNNRPSDRWLEDGSYLRMKNLTFGYRLPGSLLKSIAVKSVRLYANMDNVFTLTKYTGVDPELGVNGLDYGIYPTARTFMFGINVNF